MTSVIFKQHNLRGRFRDFTQVERVALSLSIDRVDRRKDISVVKGIILKSHRSPQVSLPKFVSGIEKSIDISSAQAIRHQVEGLEKLYSLKGIRL